MAALIVAEPDEDASGSGAGFRILGVRNSGFEFRNAGKGLRSLVPDCLGQELRVFRLRVPSPDLWSLGFRV